MEIRVEAGSAGSRMSTSLIAYSHLLKPEPERFAMSHAPYLAPLSGERVLLLWFAGSREWALDVAILCAAFEPRTRTWSPISILAKEIGHSMGNSVLLMDPVGRRHLWYVRTARHWQDGEIVHAIAASEGRPFQNKRILPLDRGWLIRGRPILRGTRLYFPVYQETEMVSAVWEENIESGAGMLREPVTAEGGLIHPVLVDFGEDEFRGFYRNAWPPNRIHTAFSMNRGGTWSRPLPTSLPNPNSGIDVVLLRDGSLLCAYNPSESKRTPLSLARSLDRGRNWTHVTHVEISEGEFSYPSLLVHGNEVLLAYTHKRNAIRVLALDPRELMGGLEAAC
jgi:predicted neuraminidase